MLDSLKCFEEKGIFFNFNPDSRIVQVKIFKESTVCLFFLTLFIKHLKAATKIDFMPL